MVTYICVLFRDAQSVSDDRFSGVALRAGPGAGQTGARGDLGERLLAYEQAR